ncbi:MAG: phytanoyl-CoA dioxygenase family protein [Armatimonadetes bacterium]|nr:phytanoyl-CoA dioxygenase family protein [Armatimonadota bacterium]MDE2207112.1 phytanoyl-CoA dioxygenase family protein [Armatimonadota bacterium]
MMPLAKPGPMTETERFLFDVAGYLVIPGALSTGETERCLEAAQRAHGDLPNRKWRQIGALYEKEPAIEELIDHPSVLPKVRALLGDYFIVQSSWCTLSPAHFPGQGLHQDGSGAYEFRRLALPTPLVQLRVGYFLTDQSAANMGNIVIIPGSHNASVKLPAGLTVADLPNAEPVCGPAGSALLFHQGVYHCGADNEANHDRLIQHIVYSPPWLIPSDRFGNDPAFMERTTPLRRALVGNWSRPEAPFGGGYDRPPFEESAS